MSDPKRLLLVDDDPVTLWGIGKILQKDGFALEACSSGRAALEALQQSEYDIMLTDLQMTGVDGLSLLDWVKANRPKMVTVAMSSYGSPAIQRICIEKGAILFLEKPVNTELLKNVLQHYHGADSQFGSARQFLYALVEAASAAVGGEVMVRLGDNVGRLYFVGEKIAWACIVDDSTTLIDDLREKAKLNAEEVKLVYEDCLRSGANFAERTIQWGLIDEDRMREILLERIASCVGRMTRWTGLQAMFAPQQRMYQGNLLFSLADVLAAIPDDLTTES
jgi:CheY-like chemotaxis protein/polyhydroxyalkanoate synthesis regulator phasin